MSPEETTLVEGNTDAPDDTPTMARPEPRIHTTPDDEDVEGFQPPELRTPKGPVQLATAAADGAPLDPVRLVEAALFTAGRPVSITEISEATGLERRKADRAMKSLAMEYEERGDACAVEVGMAGDKWAMQLKTRFVEHTHKLADMEIPKKTLKTLALIAFHQPVLQSEIVEMVGSRTYDHVKELHEHGLIRLKPEGQSKRIVTSPEFPEYFGIPATDSERIRTYLAAKVGLELTGTKGEKRLASYDEEAKAGDEASETVPVAADPPSDAPSDPAAEGDDESEV